MKWKQIERLLRQTAKRFDILAVTGDLTCHGDVDEFRMAGKYLLSLADALEIQRERILFCPGNHDADTPEKGSSFCHYQSFLTWMQEACERAQENVVYHTDNQAERIRFLSVNTCTDTSLRFFDDAVIPEETEDAIAQLSEKETAVMLMHHQPEVIKNQDRLMRIVESSRVKLILCGHLHSTQTRKYEVEGTTVINGMAITPHLPWIPSGLQLIDFNPDREIRVREIRIDS